MERDMELVRRILIQTAAADADRIRTTFVSVDGYDDRTVARHLELMHEAGLIDANLLTAEGVGALRGAVNRITWAGYDFLDAARNDTVWARTRSLVAEKGGAVPFEILKELLVHFARGLLLPQAQ